MKKVINIKLKTENGKLAAIRDLKDFFGLGLKDRLDMVNKLISEGEIDLSDTDLIRARFDNYPDDVGRKLKTIFDCEFINDEEEITSNANIDEPDAETMLAFTWYDSLSEDEKKKVDLLGKWFNRPCIAVC